MSTAPAVIAELHVGEERNLVPMCDWSWLPVLELTPDEAKLAAQSRQQLGAGEAECLALAVSRGMMLLFDDFAAKRMANQRSLPPSDHAVTPERGAPMTKPWMSLRPRLKAASTQKPCTCGQPGFPPMPTSLCAARHVGV
jgi:hypothetical protein